MTAGRMDMTRGARRSVAFLTVLILVLSGISLWWNANTTNSVRSQIESGQRAAIVQAIAEDDAKWCDTLDLLTRTPVPRPANPAANQAREENYLLYLDFLILRHRQGCR